jgi:hypothetical protein
MMALPGLPFCEIVTMPEAGNFLLHSPMCSPTLACAYGSGVLQAERHPNVYNRLLITPVPPWI